MSHMSAVVEGDLAPFVDSILSIHSIRLQGGIKAVQSVIVARGGASNIPRGFGIIQTCRINDFIVQGPVALVEVSVGLNDEVDVTA